MAQIDLERKLIRISIVYFGPPGCGKETWVRFIHDNARNSESLIEKNYANESSISFTWDPWQGIKIEGFSHIFQFRTCSFDMSDKYPERSAILSEADGLVFIADSFIENANQNSLYFNEMMRQLRSFGADVTDGNAEASESISTLVSNKISNLRILKVPLVIAYNKRDSPHCASMAELEKTLTFNNACKFEAIGREGLGTHGTFDVQPKS
ncbi:MAG: hypothetical protein NW224_17110 [Leptolyngbyaceae cyanobacterium bins.302]|nr:hypothetical protein [Leptolyngbyaceae cyanobacterium bins.302]